MIIFPEMIGSIVGIYNGKTFNQVEIKVCWHNFGTCGILSLSDLFYCSIPMTRTLLLDFICYVDNSESA